MCWFCNEVTEQNLFFSEPYFTCFQPVLEWIFFGLDSCPAPSIGVRELRPCLRIFPFHFTLIATRVGGAIEGNLLLYIKPWRDQNAVKQVKNSLKPSTFLLGKFTVLQMVSLPFFSHLICIWIQSELTNHLTTSFGTWNSNDLFPFKSTQKYNAQ